MFCALLGQDIRYQVSVYRTIGPLVYYSPSNLPLYNMVHYSTIFDITWIIAGTSNGH